jgi:hypothetical protein
MWFVIKDRCTFAEDRKTNQMAMATNWHPLVGFEVITLLPFCGITFASLSGHPIMDQDTVDIGVHVLNCTGLLPEEGTICGSSMVMMPAKRTTLSHSNYSGRTESKLQRLLLSLQASIGTAWPQPMMMHWRNLSRMRC